MDPAVFKTAGEQANVFPRKSCPHASGEERGGTRVTLRRGVSIPPNHLIRNTQPDSQKFPLACTNLDPANSKKVSRGLEEFGKGP
jgi:hypothetical protein